MSVRTIILPAVASKTNQKSSASWGAESPEWTARAKTYLEARGLTLEDAVNAKIEAINAARAKVLGFSPTGAGLYIPYVHPLTGELLQTRRIRYFDPPVLTVKGKQKQQRFSQPAGTPAEAYFVPGPDWKRIFKDANTPLHIVEGEHKAIAANKHSLITIGLGGVDSYGGSELTPLLQLVQWENRKVFISYDSDIATNPNVASAAQRFAKVLRSKGAMVIVVLLPNLIPDGKTGLDDYLRIAGVGAFIGLRDAQAQNVKAAQSGLHLECLSDVTAKPVPWLWSPYLAFGMLCMLSGDPSAGKTFIALAIAASLSTGFIPASTDRCEPVSTLFVSTENDSAYVVKPRFDALGGDPKRLYMLKGPFTLQDIPALESAIDACDAKLVIIDPLQSYLGAGVDAHRSNETRPVMDGLIRLAERKNICILIVRHMAKSSGGRAIHKGLGSVDITGAVRTEMMCGSAPDQPNKRAMVQIKNNIGKTGPSLAYEIVGKGEAAELKWLGKSDLTAADLTAAEGGNKGKNTQVARAKEFLRAELKDKPQLQVNLREEGEFTERVLAKAAQELGVVKSRQEQRGPVVWTLPKLPKWAQPNNHALKEEDTPLTHFGR